MTGNKISFTSYKGYDGGHVLIRSILKGNVISRGYSQTSKAYIVLNKETMRIEESLNVTFDESLLEPKSSPSVEDDRIIEPIVQNLNGSLSLQVNVSDEGYPKSLKEARGHPIK
nr:retrovirus-related Pol polyprotein from transposon TNT 1-94 [Tanacetum cinerariifolium]